MFIQDSESRSVFSIIYWLVVSTHLKNISQTGNLSQIGIKTKKVKRPPSLGSGDGKIEASSYFFFHGSYFMYHSFVGGPTLTRHLTPDMYTYYTWSICCPTVDGRNPKQPVDVVNISLFTGFSTSQVVSRMATMSPCHLHPRQINPHQSGPHHDVIPNITGHDVFQPMDFHDPKSPCWISWKI